MRRIWLLAGAGLILAGSMGSAEAQGFRGRGFHGGWGGYHGYHGGWGYRGWNAGGALAAGLIGGGLAYAAHLAKDRFT